jgi:hypothetical protein
MKRTLEIYHQNVFLSFVYISIIFVTRHEKNTLNALELRNANEGSNNNYLIIKELMSM